jgi:hypothetical protein
MAVVELTSSPRAVATYLRGIRPIVAQATHARQLLLRRIGQLIEEAGHGTKIVVARMAGRIGREHVIGFREQLGQLENLRPPPACAVCHASLGNWLGDLIAACDALVAVGVTGKLERLRETQEHLADGRAHARRFNAVHAQLLGELRQRCAAARG